MWRASESCGQFGTIVKLLIVTGQRRSEIGSLRKELCSLPSSKDGVRMNSLALHNCERGLAVEGENTDCEVWTATKSESEGPTKTATQKSTSEVGSSQCTITFPSHITKNKRRHEIPLGLTATSILTTLTCRDCGIAPPFNSWSKAKSKLDKLANIEPWTLHDLRRTYATNLQKLGVSLEIIETLLNHTSGTRSGIVGVYNRHTYWEEACEAVEKYDTWLQSLLAKS